MKIAFFKLEDWERKYVENQEEFKKLDAEVMFFDTPLDKDHIPDDTSAQIVCTFINSKIDKKVFDAFKNLKFITTRSTGFDHIDLQECKKRSIQVANVPKYGENTVAEYTFGLILALVRKIYTSYTQVRQTGSFNLTDLRGIDLKGKTLGVVGTGSIGQNVVRIAKGFGMNVIGCDKYPNENAARDLGFVYCDPKQALQESDILTLHVPYTKETYHLINRKNIMQLKKGAFLINTSRGQVVETPALVEALAEGHIAGAALDVMEEEGVIKDELEFLLDDSAAKPDLKTVLANHILIDMPNVIVTPHNAFNTWEALGRILDTTIENIREFHEGKPINLVKSQK
jgi:D-lactate dehydrogenase